MAYLRPPAITTTSYHSHDDDYDPSYDFGYHADGEWEPHHVQTSPPIQDIRTHIHQLQNSLQHKEKLDSSGRIIIVAHCLPYACKIPKVPSNPYPSPANTPSANHNNNNSSSSSSSNGGNASKSNDPVSWILSRRRGHSALQAGIHSLNQSHDVFVVAAPSDIVCGANDEPLSTDSLSQHQRKQLEQVFLDEYGSITRDIGPKSAKCVPVWIDDHTSHLSYEGFCKGSLWSLFHYLPLDGQPDHTSEALEWKAYSTANRAYAEKVAQIYQPGDLIWVHDYHLLLVPSMLREMIPSDPFSVPIGLFLHSPFPSSEIFRCLPRREAILDGMLGADLACFQTYSYGRHFLSSCVRVKGYEASSRIYGVDAGNRETAISHVPVGVDVEQVENSRKRPQVLSKVAALRKLYQGKKIIVGRDKLDKTKGVVPKLRAFERFLQDYPEWNGHVVLIQVTTPSASDNPQLAKQVWEMVDYINGTYGSLNFQPVHHYHQSIDRDEYFALLTAADMALITSIRDGMNTTSMEYVLCQSELKGPVFVSEFTGVAASMHTALRGNPWDLRGCARMINRGLTMSASEKEERYAQLHKLVVSQTSAVWAAQLVLELLETVDKRDVSSATFPLDTHLVQSKFKQSKKRLMLFDYDGTLTPIVKDPEAAVPSAQLLKALKALCEDESNVVYIISGRDGTFLHKHMGWIPNLGLSAEHGSFIREPGSSEWINLTQDMDLTWIKDVEDMLKYYEERTTGSFVERKAASVTFHYRNADPDFGLFQAKELQGILENMQSKMPIDVLVGKKNLEIRPAHTHKGEIVKRLVYINPDAEFVLCCGDDKTDEDMFRMLTSIVSSEESTGQVSPPGSLERYPALRRHASSNSFEPVQTKLHADTVFSVAVDPGQTRKTVARWRVGTPQDIISVLTCFVQDV